MSGAWLRPARKPFSRLVTVLVTVLTLGVLVSPAVASAAPPTSRPSSHHGNYTHALPTKPRAKAKGTSGTSGTTADLEYHGGSVMRDVTNYLIFWDPTSSYAAGYQSTIEQYFNDSSSTPFMAINSQYGDSSGLPVPATNHFGGSFVDTTNAYPQAGTYASPLTKSDIQDEVDRAIAANPTWQGPGYSTMYFVFLGQNIIECKGGSTDCFAGPGVPSADATYCAYHSSFGSKIFATMPYAASSTVCGSNANYPNGKDVDLELSPTSHEQFEAYSDPNGNAWYDTTSGNENGDNCAYTYGQIEPDGTNLVLHGHRYQMQIEWNNGNPDGCVKRIQPASTPTLTGTLNFGSVPRGTSVTRDVSLENTGSADLNLLDARFGVGAPSAFSLSPAAPRVATLPPGHSMLFHVTYSPSASASSSSPQSTTFIVDTDEPGIETQSLPVSGSPGLPSIQVTGSLDFGTVPRGTTAVRTVGVQNLGQGALNIANITIAGDPAYSISPSSPTSGALPPGGFLTVDVRFSPPASATTAGPRTATLTVTSDDSSSPTSLPATGLVGLPKAVVQPGSLDFGTVCPGIAADRQLTVTNTGTAPLTITAITLTAGSSAYLSVLPVPSLPQMLPVGGHLDFTVRLNVPGGSPGGPISGSVDVTTDDPVTPTVNLPITGTIGSGALSVSTTALDFGGVAVDDRTSPSSKDRTLTLSNTGTCAVTVTSGGLTVGGANPGDFSIVGGPSLPLSIAPGSSVQIVVRFNPSAAGPRSATLTITPAAPLTPTVVTLTGIGLVPAILMNPTPSMVFPPTVIASQAPGYPGVTQNNVVTNTGQTELIVDVLHTSGLPFNAPGPVAPPSRFAASDHFSEPVTFAPTAVGKFLSTLTVSDTGTGVGPVTANVAMCGEGVKRGIRVLAVNAAGVPFSSIARLKLQAHGTAQNVNVNAANLPLVGVPTSCDATQKRQYENQALVATDTLNQRSSYYTLAVTAGGKSTTITFVLGVSDFKTITVTIK